MNGSEYKADGYNPNDICFACMAYLLEIAQTFGFDNNERHKSSLLQFGNQIPPLNWYEVLKESPVGLTAS